MDSFGGNHDLGESVKGDLSLKNQSSIKEQLSKQDEVRLSSQGGGSTEVFVVQTLATPSEIRDGNLGRAGV